MSKTMKTTPYHVVAVSSSSATYKLYAAKHGGKTSTLHNAKTFFDIAEAKLEAAKWKLGSLITYHAPQY